MGGRILTAITLAFCFIFDPPKNSVVELVFATNFCSLARNPACTNLLALGRFNCILQVYSTFFQMVGDFSSKRPLRNPYNIFNENVIKNVIVDF